jgi:hypothetical protein
MEPQVSAYQPAVVSWLLRHSVAPCYLIRYPGFFRSAQSPLGYNSSTPPALRISHHNPFLRFERTELHMTKSLARM